MLILPTEFSEMRNPKNIFVSDYPVTKQSFLSNINELSINQFRVSFNEQGLIFPGIKHFAAPSYVRFGRLLAEGRGGVSVPNISSNASQKRWSFAMIRQCISTLAPCKIVSCNVANTTFNSYEYVWPIRILQGFYGCFGSLRAFKSGFGGFFSGLPQSMSGQGQQDSKCGDYYSCNGSESSGVSINKSKNTSEITQKDITDAMILLVVFFGAITLCIWGIIVEIWY
jgi:hypothetical protein